VDFGQAIVIVWVQEAMVKLLFCNFGVSLFFLYLLDKPVSSSPQLSTTSTKKAEAVDHLQKRIVPILTI